MQLTDVESELLNYYREYPWEYYETLPEFIIKKLGLENDTLGELSCIGERNRKDIYNWMINRNFSHEDLLWIGW